jgi:hypothetical protein
VYNGDVTDLRKPLLALFKNDFWCGGAADSPSPPLPMLPLAGRSSRVSSASLGPGRCLFPSTVLLLLWSSALCNLGVRDGCASGCCRRDGCCARRRRRHVQGAGHPFSDEPQVVPPADHAVLQGAALAELDAARG